MVREIKYKIWDREKNKMGSVVSLGLKEYPTVVKFEDGSIETYFLPDWKVVLLKWTGFKDREGTEIYYKDYIRVFWGNGTYSDKTVLWLNGAWRVTTFDLLGDVKETLLIGNEFEGVTRKSVLLEAGE